MTKKVFIKNDTIFERNNKIGAVKTETNNSFEIKSAEKYSKRLSSQGGVRFGRLPLPVKLKRSSSFSGAPNKIFAVNSANSSATTASSIQSDSLVSFDKSKSKSSKNLDTDEAGKLLKEFVKNHNTIRLYKSMPKQQMPPLHIINQEEVKRKFFENQVPPYLQFKADENSVLSILTKHRNTSYEHFFKAKHILDLINSKYVTSDGTFKYYEANFGKTITAQEAAEYVGKYLTDNRIDGELTVNFAPGLTCSGYIRSYGAKATQPESRKFVIWINDGIENQFLRKDGIISLCDHEIGTHYFRQKYGIRPLNSIELLRTEEGLAALHTIMNANLKYLYLPALLYYLACMGDKMTFAQLFNHMGRYIEKPEERWKLVTRVKRGISDPHVIGAYSRDQSYFEGAIQILENLDTIDFYFLMSGKLCLDELPKAQKIAKIEALKLPKFLRNVDKYKQSLRQIGILNGIISEESEIINEPFDMDKYEKLNSNMNSSNLCKLNAMTRGLTKYEIKKFIEQKIVGNKASSPQSNIKSIQTNGNSSLCTLL